MDVLTQWGVSFHKVCVYNITMLYSLSFNFIWQIKLHKMGGGRGMDADVSDGLEVQFWGSIFPGSDDV